MLSSRDGRLLKPVPFQCSLSSEELADKLTSLPPAFLRKLVACWARGAGLRGAAVPASTCKWQRRVPALASQGLSGTRMTAMK